MLAFPYYLLAEWLCFIASVLLVNNLDKYFTSIRVYMGFVVLIESICFYLAWIERVSNQWLYNCFILFEFSFMTWFVCKAINLRYKNWIIVISCLTFFGTYFAELINQKGITRFFSKADTVESVIMIALCMIYYYKLFIQEEYLKLENEPFFWIVTGSFIFYTTDIGVDTFFKKLVEVRISHSIPLRYLIMNILNIILYGCWIKSFLCIRMKRKYTQPL
jgi:hypothetical protein